MKITIPYKTLSNNHYKGQRNNRQFLTKEAKELRLKIMSIMNNNEKLKSEAKTFTGKCLMVKMKVYENWYNKDGTIKRKDIMNREKHTMDSIFNSLLFKCMGLDDKQIFHYTIEKIQSELEYCEVEIQETDGK